MNTLQIILTIIGILNLSAIFLFIIRYNLVDKKEIEISKQEIEISKKELENSKKELEQMKEQTQQMIAANDMNRKRWGLF